MGTIILILVIVIFLFYIFRELNNWYWKINERIAIQRKTNFLLEKLLIQLGASDPNGITVEEIATGKRKKVKIDEWIELLAKNPDGVKGFRTVKDDDASN